MKVLAFITRTRYPGRIHITDILSWVWLVVGTLMVLIPVMWAAMSSLKTPAEINRFPPSFLPQAADTVTLPGSPKPLELWQVQQEDGSSKTLAMTMLSLLPVTAVFVFLQKYITTGIANTGMK